MSCIEWFEEILRQEGIAITEDNEKAVDRAIRKFTDQHVSATKCSPDWKIIRMEVSKDPLLRQRLVEAVKEETGDKAMKVRPRFNKQEQC